MELRTAHLALRTVTEADLPEVQRMWDFEKGKVPLEEAKQAIANMKGNHGKTGPAVSTTSAWGYLNREAAGLLAGAGLTVQRRGRRTSSIWWSMGS